MGAYTCQHGTVHRMCRCPEPHTIACPSPDLCSPYVGKHRADLTDAVREAPDARPLPMSEDAATVTLGPTYEHNDGRVCGYYNRLRLWVFDGIYECLRSHRRTQRIIR